MASVKGLYPTQADLATAAAVEGNLAAIVMNGAPGWLIDLSPFQHVPPLPAAELTAVPLVILTAVAAGMVVLGVAGFARRDVG